MCTRCAHSCGAALSRGHPAIQEPRKHAEGGHSFTVYGPINAVWAACKSAVFDFGGSNPSPATPHDPGLSARSRRPPRSRGGRLRTGCAALLHGGMTPSASGTLDHACEAAGTAPGADQLAEDGPEGGCVLVVAVECGLRSSLLQRTFTRSASDRARRCRARPRVLVGGGHAMSWAARSMASCSADVERGSTGVEDVGRVAREEHLPRR